MRTVVGAVARSRRLGRRCGPKRDERKPTPGQEVQAETRPPGVDRAAACPPLRVHSGDQERLSRRVVFRRKAARRDRGPRAGRTGSAGGRVGARALPPRGSASGDGQARGWAVRADGRCGSGAGTEGDLELSVEAGGRALPEEGSGTEGGGGERRTEGPHAGKPRRPTPTSGSARSGGRRTPTSGDVGSGGRRRAATWAHGGGERRRRGLRANWPGAASKVPKRAGRRR